MPEDESLNKEQNLPDEHLNEESQTAEHNSATKITSPTENIEQPPITEQPLTENMEVHHHPDLHHRKKHFKEYFLEFLMLFLAVTLGFFAENLREYFDERKIEKDNISSLISNLASDTSQLTEAINFNENKVKGIDSFLTLKNKDVNEPAVKKQFYYYTISYLRYTYSFKTNDATLEQMKSSGTLRLITQKNILDSVSKYEFNNKNILLQESGCMLFQQKCYDINAKISDNSVETDAGMPGHFILLNSMQDITDELPDIISDKLLLKELFNDAQALSTTYSIYAMLLKQQLEIGRNIMRSAKKEYDLN